MARQDGDADKIAFWARRLDYLTDRIPRVSQTESKPAGTSIQ